MGTAVITSSVLAGRYRESRPCYAQILTNKVRVIGTAQMKIKNSTKIPKDLLSEIIAFVRPSGISKFDVMMKNSRSKGTALWGRAYPKGCSSYHRTADPFISIQVPQGDKYPRALSVYQYGQLKGRRYYLADRTEELVYILAHELRHIWQGKTKNKAGYTWGARGRYSEIDSESYAIRKLREWRRKGK